MDQKIFLTGATSFLGKRLHEVLQEKKYEVISDRVDITKPVPPIQSDIIIHAAAYVNLSREFETGKKCFEVNTLGTMNLLESVKNHTPKLFVYISSEEVYGNGPIPFKENQRPEPPSPYAISKLAGEQLSEWYGKEYGFPVAIVRLGTFYGPNQPEHKYFAQSIIHALKNEPIPCNSGQKKRDYIFLDDAVDLLLKIIEKKPTGILNGTGGKSYTLLAVLELIKKYTGSNSKVKIGAIPDRITEREEWLSDITKAKEVLDWKPTIDLEEGIKKTVEYFEGLETRD